MFHSLKTIPLPGIVHKYQEWQKTSNFYKTNFSYTQVAYHGTKDMFAGNIFKLMSGNRVIYFSIIHTNKILPYFHKFQRHMLHVLVQKILFPGNFSAIRN